MESNYESTTIEVPTDFFSTDLVRDFNNVLSGGSLQQRQKFDCRTYNFVILGLFGLISITFGLVGNGLSVVILWKDKWNSPTLFLLLCLALTDSLVLVSNGFLTIVPVLSYIKYFQATSLLISLSYVYMGGITTMFVMMSIWTTVLVTWHRYVNICIPFKAKQWGTLKQAKKQFAVIIIASILFSLPKFFERNIVSNKQQPGFYSFVETPLMKNKLYYILYNTVLYYIFFYILPVLMLIFMTVPLMKSMSEFYKNRKHLTSSKSVENKQEITMSLIIVVVVFLICHLVGPALRLMMVFEEDRSCGSPYSKFAPLNPLFIEISSAVNFVIYMLCMKRFRAKIRLLFHNVNQVSTTGVP